MTQPACYGKHWDPNATECRGGLDPSYANPKTGSNRREICSWYQSCSAQTNHAKLQSAALGAPPPPPRNVQVQAPQPPPQQFVPAQALTRVPALAPPPPTQYQQHPPQQNNAQVQHYMPQQVVYAGQVPYTQPSSAAQPVMVPMNQPMPGAATQTFLMVPEPEDESVPWGIRMWRNTYRAMGKAGLITMANFLDYNPIGGFKR